VTDEEHNKYISYLFFAHGAFQLLMMLIMVSIFSTIFIGDPELARPGPPQAMVNFVMWFMLIFQSLLAAPALIAGYAVLNRRSWARTASIIAGVVSAMNVPIGMAAAVYSLWFFLGERWKSVYPEKAEAGDHRPHELTDPVDPRWTGYYTDEKGEVVYQPVEPPDWR
jgi:hypothetical protein